MIWNNDVSSCCDQTSLNYTIRSGIFIVTEIIPSNSLKPSLRSVYFCRRILRFHDIVLVYG